MRRRTAMCMSGLLVLSLLFGGFPISQHSLAVEPSEWSITPYTTYIKDAKVTFSISDGTATVYAYVTGTVGKTTKANVTATLQKYNSSTGKWSDVQTWTASASSHTASLNKTKSVSSGIYRVKAVCKTYQNSSWESKTLYSASKST